MGTYTDLLKLTPKKPLPLSPVGEVVFGQNSPSETTPIASAEATPLPSHVPLPEAESAPTQMPESQNARNLASPNARKQESQNARNLANQKARMPENKKPDLNGFLSSMLNAKTLAKTSYRYPQDLLDKLADVEFELRRNKGKKVHMNTIVVFALAYLLWEYEERGEKSLLATLT